MAKYISLPKISNVYDFNKQVQSLPPELYKRIRDLTSAAIANDKDFIARLHDLPSEIYSQVRDLTFTPDFQETCHIEDSYEPPSILQVDQQSRSELSPTFYGNTIFTFPNDFVKPYRKCAFRNWLECLTAEHRGSLLSTELHILTGLKIANYFGPVERGTGVCLYSRHMSSSDRIALQPLRREVYDALSGCGVLWAQAMEANVRFICLMDNGIEVVLDGKFRSKFESPSLRY